MKKALLLTTICFFHIHTLKAQVVIEWQKCLGGTGVDEANSIKQTTDGGYVLAGVTTSNNGDVSGNHGGYDYWVVKLDSIGNLQWQKCLGGSFSDWAHSIQQTTDGGYVVAGGTESFNGDVTSNHGDFDYWIVKLDNIGNIQWQKSFGGTSFDFAYSIQQTTDGGFVVAGRTNSNDGDVSGNHGGHDYWVVKLDSIGNIQWQKCLGGTDEDAANSIHQTTDGGYVVAGWTESNDGDVSGYHGNYDCWIVKLDSGGTFQWQKCLGGTGQDYAYSIQQTTDGGYVVAGHTRSNDGDVSGNHGNYDYLVVKLDSLGNIQWQKCLGGTNGDGVSSIEQTTDGGYVVAGNTYSNNGDVSGNHGGVDYWVVKLDSVGNIQWQKCLGGTGQDYDYAYSIQQTTDGGYVVAGYNQSNDGDVTGNHGDRDYWVVKLTTDVNQIIGKLYADLNSNNVQDLSDPFLINRKLTEQSTGRFTFSDANGNYNLSVLDSGMFSVSPSLVNYYTASPTNHSAVFTGIYQTDSLNDFAFQPTGIYNDLCLSISPMGPFRSGFNASYMINYSNVGTTTINNINITFYLDTNLTYVSSNTVPSNVASDSIVWNIGSLSPFQSGSVLVTVNVNLGVPIGSLINSWATIEPKAGDAYPGNNNALWEVFTIGSFDPNDILVDQEILFNTQFPNPPYLEYIIRFQNTGNDTAFTVSIQNNISELLDVSSFEYLASSHPMSMSYQNHSRLFTYTFDNILLPDSNINEPGSHGFVRYRIRPNYNLAVNDSIKNSAAIYFDFNAPVLTNTAITTVTTFVDLINVEQNKQQIKLYPNPANDVLHVESNIALHELNVYDALGRLLITKQQSKTPTTQTTLNVNSLSNGIYIIEAQSKSQSIKAKFVKR